MSFVDGDDVMSPRYVQTLYEAYARELAHNHGRRTLAMVRSRHVLPGDAHRVAESIRCGDGGPRGRRCLRRLLIGRFGHTAWGGIASRQLYLDIPFSPIHRGPYRHSRLRLSSVGSSLYIALANALTRENLLYGFSMFLNANYNTANSNNEVDQAY